ncbi:Glycosyl hydrolases family 15 [compost metagenome]
MLKESYKILDSIRLSHGLYLASPSEHYSYVWVRDSVYIAYPYVDKNDGKYELAYHRLLDLFKEYEWKIDIAIKQKPNLQWEYLHAKYTAHDVKEIHNQEWGHAQNDMIGAFLFGIGEGIKYGRKVIRDDKDIEIIQKLVYYLDSVQYWHDEDNGMWEEWKEVHMSSVGACVAGLKAVEKIVHVPYDLVEKGINTCLSIFPNESISKRVDLAQLSLIYPYNVFGLSGEKIVRRVEDILTRERGVIRYEGDSYYSTLENEQGRGLSREDYYGTEAEWCFGFPWLALCYHQLGNIEKAKFYLKKTEEVMVKPGILPELYYANSNIPNPNTPLGWSVAMYILAKEKIKEMD